LYRGVRSGTVPSPNSPAAVSGSVRKAYGPHMARPPGAQSIPPPRHSVKALGPAVLCRARASRGESVTTGLTLPPP